MIYQIKTKIDSGYVGPIFINEYRCSRCGNTMGKRPSNNKCTSCKR